MNFLKAEEGVSGLLRVPWQFLRTEGQGDSKIMFSQMFVWCGGGYLVIISTF